MITLVAINTCKPVTEHSSCCAAGMCTLVNDDVEPGVVINAVADASADASADAAAVADANPDVEGHVGHSGQVLTGS